MKCAFCEISEIRERTIHENEHAWAFPTNIPITVGHTLVCPKRCVVVFDELTADERESIFSLAQEIKQALKGAFRANGFNYAWNEGKVAGQSVPHFHLHIVPRAEGDTGILEYEPRQFLYRPGSREPTPEAELRAVAEEIKSSL